MNISKNSKLDEDKFLFIITILLSILPAVLLIKTLISNSVLFLICLSFLLHCFYKKILECLRTRS